MIKKILNLVKQMSRSEQVILHDYIKGQYCLEEKQKGNQMLREEIKTKICDLITANFTDPTTLVMEESIWVNLNMNAVDVTELADMILVEFELEEVVFSKLMEWESVKDVVDYIEDSLECVV